MTDLAALREENAVLRQQLAATEVVRREENAAQRVQIALLVDQIAKLTERVAELLAVAQRKQRKPPITKP